MKGTPKNRLNSKQNKAQMKTCKDRKLHKLFMKLFKLGPSKSLGPFILMDYAMPLQDNKATQLLHEGWVPHFLYPSLETRNLSIKPTPRPYLPLYILDPRP